MTLEASPRWWHVAGAFLRVDLRQITSYPMALILQLFGTVMPVFIYYFVAAIAGRPTDSVGSDYFTFVVIGVVGLQTLAAGLQGFGQELEYTIQQGRLEMLLVMPVRWRWLPLALLQVPLLVRVVSVSLIIAISVPMGATFDAAGVPAAIAVGTLGVVAGFAVGLLAASIKVLAKRGDPVITFYLLAASVLSGVYFPLDILPGILRAAAYALPHTYVVAALRHALMVDTTGLTGPGPGESIVALAILCALILPVAMWTFGRALTFGRRAGVLASY